MPPTTRIGKMSERFSHGLSKGSSVVVYFTHYRCAIVRRECMTVSVKLNIYPSGCRLPNFIDRHQAAYSVSFNQIWIDTKQQSQVVQQCLAVPARDAPDP